MDLLFHLLLPILLLLLFEIKLSKRHYIILAFFSVLPDFDRLILKSKQGFHSLFFIALVLLFLYLLARKNKERNLLLALAAFGMFSHVLFDLGSSFSPLYPLDQTFYKIGLNIKIIGFLPVFFFSIARSLPVEQGYGILLSEQGFAVLFLLIVLAILQKKKKE